MRRMTSEPSSRHWTHRPRRTTVVTDVLAFVFFVALAVAAAFITLYILIAVLFILGQALSS